MLHIQPEVAIEHVSVFVQYFDLSKQTMFALGIPFPFHFFQVVVAVCFEESPFCILTNWKDRLV